MTIKPDRWIRRMAQEHKMIEPFAEATRGKDIVSYGLTSYGYDLRCADEFKIIPGHIVYSMSRGETALLDPYGDNDWMFETVFGRYLDIPPGHMILARSLEYFRIPRNVSANVQGKSTLARCGLIVNVTPLEPEWEGYITMEISNTAPIPARIYANQGIGQVQFFESDEPCEVSYADKQGKYQSQTGVVTSRPG